MRRVAAYSSVVRFLLVFVLSSATSATAQTWATVPFPSVQTANGSNEGGYATAQLADGRVLVTGGIYAHWPYDFSIYYEHVRDAAFGAAIAGNTWTPASDMLRNRMLHTMTRLNDGRVLAVGGTSQYPYQVLCHSYSCAPRAWASTGALVDQGEVFDPATGSWSATAPMLTPRIRAQAVTLADGRVLVAGGTTFVVDQDWTGWGLYIWNVWEEAVTSVEIYDPSTDSWSEAAAMPALPAGRLHLRSLPDGRVFGFGDSSGLAGSSAMATVYSPATNTWSDVTPAGERRARGTVTALQDGRILIAGGYNAGDDWRSWPSRLFDPAGNSWSDAPPIPENRIDHGATVRADGTVIVGGGNTSTDNAEWPVVHSSYVFAPATNSWAPGPALNIDGSQVSLHTLSRDWIVSIVATGQGSLHREMTAPTAVEANHTIAGAPGVITVTDLDGSASHDADGDAIVNYAWSIGPRVLATGSSPQAHIEIESGTHVVTLTVTDATGQTGSAPFTIQLNDVTQFLSGQLAACSAALAAQQPALDAAAAAVAALQLQLTELQQSLAAAVGDAGFVIPGATPAEQTQNLATAIGALNPGQKKALYDVLTGKKKK